MSAVTPLNIVARFTRAIDASRENVTTFASDALDLAVATERGSLTASKRSAILKKFHERSAFDSQARRRCAEPRRSGAGR